MDFASDWNIYLWWFAVGWAASTAFSYFVWEWEDRKKRKQQSQVGIHSYRVAKKEMDKDFVTFPPLDKK